MRKALVTAFEPYDRWKANASWLALVELTQQLPGVPSVTTRLYPVDVVALQETLVRDLAEGYDVVLHLGQAPGAACIRLETVGINVISGPNGAPYDYAALVADGPAAYFSGLPLGELAATLRQAGIPAQVSFHAGTYLCNAALYLTHYLAEQMGLATQAAFIHLPIDVSQVIEVDQELPSLPVSTSASAVRMILEQLASCES